MDYKCKHPDCLNKRTAKGLCQTHYDRQRSQDPKRRFAQVKRKAHVRNLELSLTEDEVSNIANKGCFYCGSTRISYGHGLDRIDSNKGYTLDNVVACCGGCNKLKQDLLTLEETKRLVLTLKNIRGYDVWEKIDRPTTNNRSFEFLQLNPELDD